MQIQHSQIFVTFIAKLSRETTDPVYSDFFPKRDKPKPRRQWSSGSAYTKPVNTTQTNTNGRKSHAKSESHCVMCNQPHRLWNCPKFCALTLKDKLHVANSKKLCHNCLRSSHTAEQCGKKSVCSVVGCSQKHTMWIHDGDHRVGQSREIYSNSVPLSPPHWPYPKPIRPPSWPRVAVASSIQNTKLFTWRTWPGAGAVPKCGWAARSQCGGSKQWRADHTKYIWYVATQGQSVIITELMIAWIW